MSRSKEKHHSHESAGNVHQESGTKEEPAARDSAGSASDSGFADQASPEHFAQARASQAVGPLPTIPASHDKAPAVDLPGEKAALLEKLQDQLLRLRADFDNFRKRTLREKTELYDMAASELMLELLPVLDHLQLGIQAATTHKADKAIQEGLQLIFDQLMGVLMKFGLTPFDAEKQPFDPARFEAISRMASDKEPEDMVLAQTRPGYMLGNKLLRPAQVVVSSGPAKGEPEAGKGAGASPSEVPLPEEG
ncbi:MAG: nucleotide exchange factor GrpE [Kiritimatiellae bacterium]|nr:nucleotide exchange factor GrpE [Verrucomicrobiota bacterium]MBU4291691.1 nucleotide exchange factor GrpE [Verrucomicrobiota bacterium]MCG2680420.1 nucleotide exchange factor GrpE [Kiritimatiellia bacterium]